jgi:hypothetical protein
MTPVDKKREAFIRLLNYFDKMATKHNWTYFMAFGTLLGSWRHHDIIPWDHDTDLWVEYKDRRDIVDKIDEQDRFVPKQGVFHKIRLHDSTYITSSQYGQKIGRYYNPSIDMFFFNRNATYFRKSDPDDPWMGPEIHKIDEIFPLHRRPFGTLMLPAPRDTLKMLLEDYGTTSKCGGSNPKQPDCKQLEPYLAFVHRKWDNETGLMKESLVLNKTVLHVKMIAEMKENMPLDPYSLDSKRFH